MEEKITQQLALLHYSPEWLAHNFLTLDALQKQVETYHRGEDQGREHYRYGTFRWILYSRTSMSDEQVEHFIELAQKDEDSFMARAALWDLLQWKGLSQQQLDRLSEDPRFEHPGYQKIILHRRLYTELQTSPLTADLFERCLATRDDGIQRYLLEECEPTRNQMAELAEKGVNRAVRNIARERLRRRRHVPTE
jgi:hypothetical protein